jgi:phosphatidylinositol glycan class U
MLQAHNSYRYHHENSLTPGKGKPTSERRDFTTLYRLQIMVEKRTVNDELTFATSHLTWVTTLIRASFISWTILPDDLQKWLSSPISRSLLVDPVLTVDHVEEALAIRSLFEPRFANAYVGSRIHLPPLLLAAAEASMYWLRPWGIATLIILVDFRIAHSLEYISRKWFQREAADTTRELVTMKEMDARIVPQHSHFFPTGLQSDSFFTLKELPLLIAQLYYCNPVTVLAGSGNAMGFSYQSLLLLFLTESLRLHSMVASAFCLSIAAYMNIHQIVFVIPLSLLPGAKPVVLVSLFVVFSVILQGLSYLLTGNLYYQIFIATNLHTFSLKGVVPSLTTIWYLGMEVFLRFRVYIEFLIAGTPYMLIIPTTIRLYKYPAVLVACFWMLGVLFRPPGTLYDLNIGFCFMLLSPRSLSRMIKASSIICLCALPIPTILYAVGYWMWLEPGNGEANYMYFQCLAYNIFVAIIFLNFCSASIRRDKALRMTVKQLMSNSATADSKTDNPK